MSFDNPRYFWLLILFVIIIPVLFVRYRKSRAGTALFAVAAPSKERSGLLRELRLRIAVSDFLFLLFAVFLVAALAGPRWGTRIVPDYRRGVDVVFAFDLSRSMDVRDCPATPESRQSSPGEETISRFRRGKEIAGELASLLGDVRLGAAIGKGQGILAVPLTYDRETISGFLSGLDSQALTGKGTNLELLINAASGAFQDSIPSRRSIILFTDGESLSGSFQAAAERARKAGISLSAVGLGSDRGGPVPLAGRRGEGQDSREEYLTGADGKPVISTRQGNLLQSEAERSGGVYVDAARNDAALVLADTIASLSAETRLSGYRREANPRWRIFVLAAMTCLGGARIMGFSRRSRRRNSARGAARNGKMPAALLILLLFSSCTKIQGKLFIMEGNFFNVRGFYTDAITSYLKARNYDAPYAEYGLGSAYYALDENNAALERYKAALNELSGLKPEDNRELRYRINYNSGIIYFEKGEYREAAQAFREALKEDPGRIEAKRNLELSLLTINRNNSSQPVSSEGKSEAGREDGGGNAPLVFRYLREMEQKQWKSREWTSESDTSGLDY